MLTASRDASRSLPKFLGVCLIVTGWLIFGMSSTASAAEQLSGINLPEIGHCGHCMPPITEADWNLIHASGFKIIRLPIDPDYIFSDGTVSEDRKSTRLNSVTNAHLVCRLLLETNNTATVSDTQFTKHY